jgi:transcriptional regulator with XRE-family HTH domain
MENLVLFGRKVRAVREAHRYSREAAAERAGISATYLGEIERGEKWPSLDVILALATSLDSLPSSFFEFSAEETDQRVLQAELAGLLASRDPEQLQMALRLLKAVFRL